MTGSDTMGLKPLIAKLAEGENLSEAEAEGAFEIMMSGAATPAQIGGLLIGLRIRGETVAEITGATRAMRAKARIVKAPPNAIDTCGTGGDGSGSFNISTAAALVVAGCGVPVAKHGNRGLTSRSGSSEVLAELGVKIDAGDDAIQQCLWRGGIGFLMAPLYHAATRHVAAARLELGTRTIFNLLGPLANPAGTRFQVIGVYSPKWVEPLALVLGRLGTERAWVVHGEGLDELTTTGISQVAELRDGKVITFEVTPEEAGLPMAKPSDLKGGDPAENARTMRRLLDGERGPIRDIVLMNAGAALVVAGQAEYLRQGVERAAQSIDSGAARDTLSRLIEITNEPIGT